MSNSSSPESQLHWSGICKEWWLSQWSRVLVIPPPVGLSLASALAGGLGPRMLWILPLCSIFPASLFAGQRATQQMLHRKPWRTKETAQLLANPYGEDFRQKRDIMPICNEKMRTYYMTDDVKIRSWPITGIAAWEDRVFNDRTRLAMSSSLLSFLKPRSSSFFTSDSNMFIYIWHLSMYI